jgi:YD repeat-containing protein
MRMKKPSLNACHHLLLATVLISSACAGDGEDRAAYKLSEIETTTVRGSTTTIERLQLAYQGSHLTNVVQYVNGSPASRAAFIYGVSGIDRIQLADKDGDRASVQRTYTDGRLARERTEVTGVYVDEDAVTYAMSGDVPKEIAHTHSATGTTAKTTLTRFEYDAQNRLSRSLYIDGTSTSSIEVRYDEQGRPDRVTDLAGMQVGTTYELSYTPSGKLDEIVDNSNQRYTLTYGEDGRLAEIRWLGQGTTTTTRYTYASGSVDGIAFAPAVPLAELFDLAGTAHDTVDLLASQPSLPSDIPSSGSGDGSGGGGGGGGGQSCGFTPQTACETCLCSSCPTQTSQCLTGSPCDSYYQCYAACSTSDCQSQCASNNPQGYSAYNAFAMCGQTYCSASCQ